MLGCGQSASVEGIVFYCYDLTVDSNTLYAATIDELQRRPCAVLAVADSTLHLARSIGRIAVFVGRDKVVDAS